jgi:hypothetical protein
VPFQVHLDTGKALARVEKMTSELVNFPVEMAEELTEWQTKDMRRRYPNTELNGKTAETSIWPTSRIAHLKSKTGMHKTRFKSRTSGAIRKGSGSSRPILRPILFDKLVERMAKLMEEHLSWR